MKNNIKQKRQKWAKIKKKTTKLSWRSLCASQLLLGTRTALKRGCIPSNTPWWRTDYSLCYQVAIANSFLVRGSTPLCCHQCWDPLWLGPWRSCACFPSPYDFIYVPLLFSQGDTISLESSITCGSYSPSASSFTLTPEPWGQGLLGDIPFRTECSKVSHSLPSTIIFKMLVYVSQLILFLD